MDSQNNVRMLEGVAAGASTLSSYTTARLARAQAQYDARVADAEQADAIARGRSKEARQHSRTDRAVGSVRAQVAGRGFAVGAGTAGDLEASTDLIGRLDALTIRENASREALKYQLEGINARARARSISPGGEAMGTLIGESAKIARRWKEEER